MSSALQRLINDLDQLTLNELWQLMSQIMSYIQRRTNALKIQVLKNQSIANTSVEQRKVRAREVLMSTRGSWGGKTLDEIDAELDRQRQDDWGENLLQDLLANPIYVEGFVPLKRDEIYRD